MKLKTMNLFVLLTVLCSLFTFCGCLRQDETGVCVEEIPTTKTKRVPMPCGKKKCNGNRRSKIITQLVAVSTIQCCKGWEYISANDTCKAICPLGCEKGKCVAPGDCRCDPPLLLVNNNTCAQPTCEIPCVNAQCTGNNTCTCSPGFEQINATHCGPQCLEGYRNDAISLECLPICDIPCVNGTCTAPNVCNCREGFIVKEDDNNTCVPLCDPNCLNGDCIAPNNCACHEKYRPENSWTCIPICQECENGECISPGLCRCLNGYSKKDGIKCTPDCDNDCINGKCVAPNNCICNPNYQFDSNNSTCEPICEPGCINAFCSLPNTCNCLHGYETTEISRLCQPKCENCENGECTAPGQCNCFEGYSKTDNNICTPVCQKPCANGYCSSPNNCTCREGYRISEEDRYSCIPVCNTDCINSNCVGPNNCKCSSGYEPTKDDNVCKPICSSCVNGECIFPEFCKCSKGYDFENGTCSPICSTECINGFCSHPEECTCQEHYIKNESNPFVCYKLCGLCEFGKCTVDGCICDFDYDLIDNTCVPKRYLDCYHCNGTCADDIPSSCKCFNSTRCKFLTAAESAEVAPSRRLAGLEITWMVGAVVGLLLVTLVVIVMGSLWRKRKQFQNKTIDHGTPLGSVIYTVPDTLMHRSEIRDDTENYDGKEFDEPMDAIIEEDIAKETGKPLLRDDNKPRHDFECSSYKN